MKMRQPLRGYAIGLVALASSLLPLSIAAAGSRTPPANFSVAAGQLMSGYTARDQFSGYVLVAHEGRPLFSQGFGFADRDARRVPTATTRFRIGSITKHFTATALLMLIADGKVGLDDPVRKFYAAAPPAWDGIRVRELLEFRTGLFNLTYLPQFGAAVARNADVEQQLALLRDIPLEFAPGARFAYNNSDPLLQGYIIERASGMSYRRVIEERVFEPAGMRHSGYEFEEVPTGLRATGYELRAGEWRPARLFPSGVMHSAGAIHSTAQDLLAWDQRLYSNDLPARLLREQSRVLAPDQSYHFGFFAEPLSGHASEYAGGGQPGFLSFFYRFPQERVTIIVLSNLQSAPVMKIGQELARLFFGIGPPAPPAPVMVPAEQLDRYVGIYELYPGARLVLTRNGHLLQMRRMGGMPPPPPDPETLVAIGPAEFVGNDCRVQFDTTGTGPAPRLNYIIPRLKTERPAPRVMKSPGPTP